MIELPEIKSKNIIKVIQKSHFTNYKDILPNDLKKYNGDNIKMSIIGTGLPCHQDFNKPFQSFEVFADNTDCPDDIHGLSTMLSGVISASSKNTIQGIAPNVSMYFTKASSDKGEIDYSAIIASMLWSIVKSVNIIYFPLIKLSPKKSKNNEILLDTVEKAYNLNIPVFTSIESEFDEYKITQNYIDEIKKLIPKIFIIKTKYIKGDKIKISGKDKQEIIISLPQKQYCTTIGEKNYIDISNSSIVGSGILLGISSVVIQILQKNKNYSIDNFYNRLVSS
jgi:hypothetical protein